MIAKNKLFRDAFKMRQRQDMAIVDKHFDALCKFTEEAANKMSPQNFSILTPEGAIHFEKRPVDFTFSFERVKGKKSKKK